LSEDLLRFPRFADKAAPAAICCFFDFAGIITGFCGFTHEAVRGIPGRKLAK
jgi:hypothetical protein